MNCLISTLIALLVFTAYNVAVLTKFGVPASLSDSFYLWNKTKKGLGFPQYCNDDIVIPGLIKLGYAPKDAHDYGGMPDARMADPDRNRVILVT